MARDLPGLGGQTLTRKAQSLMSASELQEVTSCWQPISREVPQADPSGRVASRLGQAGGAALPAALFLAA